MAIVFRTIDESELDRITEIDATEDGTFVSACPSKWAVGLYRSLGFGLADRVHPELHELDPEDIHMTLDLRE